MPDIKYSIFHHYKKGESHVTLWYPYVSLLESNSVRGYLVYYLNKHLLDD